MTATPQPASLVVRPRRLSCSPRRAAPARRRAETIALPSAAPKVRRSRSRGRAPTIAALVILVAAAAAGALLALDGSDEPQQVGSKPRAPSFEDGTLLTTTNGSRPYVVKAGAIFAVPPGERAAFRFEGREVRKVSAEALRRLPRIPREGALIRAYRSTVVWSVRGRTRRLIEAAPGADVVVVPSTGIAQIPPASGRRRTQVTLVAPSFVLEHRRFVISARVLPEQQALPRERASFTA